MKQVKCRSGITGSEGTLHERYGTFEEWRVYCEMYGLNRKLGFKDIRKAWEANPVVQSSVNPSDFCKVIQKRVFAKV